MGVPPTRGPDCVLSNKRVCSVQHQVVFDMGANWIRRAEFDGQMQGGRTACRAFSLPRTISESLGKMPTMITQWLPNNMRSPSSIVLAYQDY